MTYKTILLNEIYDSGTADEIEMQYIAKLGEDEIKEIRDDIVRGDTDAYDQFRDLQLEQEVSDNG